MWFFGNEDTPLDGVIPHLNRFATCYSSRKYLEKRLCLLEKKFRSLRNGAKQLPMSHNAPPTVTCRIFRKTTPPIEVNGMLKHKHSETSKAGGTTFLEDIIAKFF